MRRKNIRLLIMGDEQVGKSSLIYSIISEVTSNIEKTLKKVILPPEMCIYSKQIFTELIDTSSNTDFQMQINHSDLILLVYDVSNPITIDNIENQWMKIINKINKQIPVILVGNKVDKKQLQFEEGETDYVKVKDILKKITRKYKQVQMGIQCSAFYERNVQSVLNCAQRAVLYPLYPLYNLETKELTKKFKQALTRIFRILDTDLDGRLYDSQLNSLQERVFQSQLNIQDIKAIKQIIVNELKEYQSEYIDLNGFLAFQKKCIQMLKIQICWSILRYFNYDDNLEIIVKYDHFEHKEGEEESLYLSNQAVDFLLKLHSFATNYLLHKQKQNKLKQMEDDQASEMDSKHSELVSTTLIQKIFQCSLKVPLPQFKKDQNMSEERFINLWNMYSFINNPQCYENLLYLGYQSSVEETFSRKRPRTSLKDFQKFKEIPVYSILIIDCPEYRQFLDGIFVKGEKVDHEQTSYERQARLYTGGQKSKIFLFFRISKQQIKQFFVRSRTFMRRIDLIINFEPNEGLKDEEIRDIIPETTLYRRATKTEVEEEFKIFELSQLNFGSFPVEYRPESYNGFFAYLLNTIENIQLGLSREMYEKLKLMKKRSNEIIISAVGFCGFALIAGAFIFKRFRQ